MSTQPKPDWLPKKKPPVTSEEEKQESLPAFPEIAWRGLFADYRAAMDGTTEASDVAHFVTFWSAAGVVLGRNVHMVSGDMVYPNTYLCFFGPSGDKKTTAMRRITSYCFPESFPIKILRGTGSTEGIVEQLGVGVHLGIFLFFWEDFASTLGTARWKGSTLLEFLTEVFDCPSIWERSYRGKASLYLETPTPSVLTASTAEWFWKYARPEDFHGGAGNRFLFLCGAKKAPIPNPVKPNGEIIHRIKGSLNAMEHAMRKKAIQGEPYCAHWTEGAEKVWNDFYIRFESLERQGLLAAAVKRAHVYVRKLAMTYAALEDTLPYVHKDQLLAAIAVIEYSVQCTEKLIEMQAQGKPQGELEERFLRYISLHPDERVRRLQQKMARYCGDAETFNRVLKSLQQADRIEIENRCVRLSR